MGGGKASGGSSVEVPGFVRQAQKRVSEVGRQVFDISKPGLQAGGEQALNLIATGGPGARVPIINQAVAAQQRGTQQATRAIGEALNRAGTGPALSDRILQQVARQGEAQARNIPIRAAVPLITGAAGTALGGSQAGSRGVAGGLQALAGGLRAPQPSGKPGGGDIVSGLVSLFGGGGSFPGVLRGIGGGKGGQSFGSGTAPGGGLIIGQSGILGGGV